ncbi:MAG TPA: mannosyltransferase family protein [Thermoleophilia bacterium]|nr:mannosyltransferase family protein [Thermoleophilia bacterium]
MADPSLIQTGEPDVAPDGETAAAPPPLAAALTGGPARDARRAFLAAAGTRVFLIAVALITTFTVGLRARPVFMRDPAHIEVFTGLARRLLEPWANWDGVWFIRIAAAGYHSHAFSQAFFPLYPLAVRVVTPLAGHFYVVAGVTVSLACYAAAMVLLYRLAALECGSRVALWSVVFVSVFPTAFFFQAVYSESMFLLFTLLSFSAGRRGRWWLAGVAGLLAALTRSSGLLLLLPLALMWWEQRRGMPLRLPGGPKLASAPAAGTDQAPRRPSVLSFGWLALVPAGLGLYMAYLWRAFSDPFLFSAVQVFWGRRSSLPPAAIWDGAVAAYDGVRWLALHGVGALLSGPHTVSGGLQSDVIANPLEFLALVTAIVLVVVCWRKLPAAYTVYGLAALLFPLLYPTTARPLDSLPRFLAVMFPFFIALAAGVVERPVWRWTVVALFGSLLVLATVLFASFI